MPRFAATPRRRPSTPPGPRRGVVLAVPPWPAGGSANVFAAQVAAHAASGRDVLLLVAPHDPCHRSDDPAWRAATSAAFLERIGAEVAAGVRVGFCVPRPERPAAASLSAGDVIAARHAHAAGLVPDEALSAFARGRRVDLVHVNHVYSLGVVDQVLAACRRRFRRRPGVVCETHDVQADGILAQGVVNPATGLPDGVDALRASEAALLARADRLVHITVADRNAFRAALPRHDHRLLPAAIAPVAEAALSRLRGTPRAAGGFDVLYVGDGHRGNVATLAHLLGEVMPMVLRERPGTTLGIAGGVATMFAELHPEAARAWSGSFLGRVPDLVPLYAAAGCVYAASLASTGSSIKLVEGLCTGRPVVSNAEGLRGLVDPREASRDLHFAAGVGPRPLARAVLEAVAEGDSTRGPALYDRAFSNAGYRAAFADAVLDPVARGRRRAVPADPRGLGFSGRREPRPAW